MIEIWKDIPGYEGMYQVSNLGRVKSLARLSAPGKGGGRRPIKEKILTNVSRMSGHMQVNLSKNGTQNPHDVHVLVAKVFLGDRPNGLWVCHNDGNPSNNALSNLRYDTPKGNAADTLRHGTRQIGEKHALARLTEAQVLEIRNRRASGESCKELGVCYGISDDAVTKICIGKNWRHLGGPITKLTPVGDNHPNAKIPQKDIPLIRQRVTNGEKYADIAKDYDVDKTLIGKIYRGEIWRHV